MRTCPSCADQNPDDAKFCMGCGERLDPPSRPPAEERKVVTTLFCDLVGFTATSELADPEDIDRLLNAYNAMARRAIESFGGVVEKFIGDAVVGVFGVPAAHEDDPERAVRAGLRIVEGAEELSGPSGEPLRVRVGINTGEALVRLGVRPGSGEGFLRGDVVNTASRLQSVAPEMGVVVGLATYEATEPVFDYVELGPATLKGKAEPVRVFLPRAPKARFGTDLARDHSTPFIGREIDLALLKGIFDKTVAARAAQFVTVVGEPGLGKSRIVAELFRHIDQQGEVVTWRQGRCLAYGEGVTFWALGEIVKAHAGILESDPPFVAEGKLDAVLPTGDERAWFRQRILPLLGIEATSQADREESFTAWRRFLEHIAEQGPAVFVIEDLHWADDAMLAFLEHVADRAEGVPLLLIGTARPELFERRPDHARGLRNHTPINLAPLTDEETARLLSSLLETSVMPADLQAAILDRSSGNPLYAEEFVHLMRDQHLLVRQGQSWGLADGAEIRLPGSLQALIAARLDTLPAERKAMLADAAVVGKVFWSGAVAEMGNVSEAEVRDAMHELTRKELVRPSRRSSMAEQTEYAFWHVLTRDVAYAQIPRASRAARHVAAATWIESRAPDRLEDLADVLAYHYTSALDLARASRQEEHARAIEAPALRFLTLAGERALELDTAAALASFERALELTPPGHPDRAEVLARYGQAALDGGRSGDAVAALEEAIATFRERGDPAAQARTMFRLIQAMAEVGDPRTFEIGDEALAMLEPLPPGPELVGAIVEVARARTLSGGSADGAAFAERALMLTTQLGLPVPPRALGYRGLARCALADPRGLADLREALRIAIDTGQGRESGLLYNNLGRAVFAFEGPGASLEAYREGISFARARGLSSLAVWMGGGTLEALGDLGRLDEALDEASRLREEAEAAAIVPPRITIAAARARLLAVRGDVERARDTLDWLESTTRETKSPEILIIGLGSSAIARAALGQVEPARELLNELAVTPLLHAQWNFYARLPTWVRAALSIGEVDLARRLVPDAAPDLPYADHAMVTVAANLAEADRDLRAAADGYANAADRWERFGVAPEQGFALLGHGRCQLALSRPADAVDAIRRARSIFVRCGMRPAVAESDDVLARGIALSS